MVKHNFNSGPSKLPDEVFEQTAQAVLDYNGSGLSILEIGHRSEQFQEILDEARQLFKEILNIPAGYEVLFIGGGASMEFCRIPYNFLHTKAAFLDTGVWSEKAIVEAKFHGVVEVIASSADRDYAYIPRSYEIPTDADYLHITTNNTIYGTEFHDEIDSPIPLVADMSSNIFSRPIDVSKYSCIYGGVQKNLGPAGLSFIVVKEAALDKMNKSIPSIMNYKTHVDEGSMFNTPPVLPIYTSLLTLRWIKANGGVEAMEKLAIERSTLLYNEIDRNSLFKGTVDKADRSRMNIRFVMTEGNEHLEEEFIAYAESKGAVNIRGHRTTGGFRASCYNAMTIEGVQVLVDAMASFEAKHK